MKEGIQALEAVLALNGITMVNVGDKFVKVVPEAQSGSAAAPFNTETAAQLPDLGQYVTHIVQLKYAKPSDLVPVLTPFAKIPNGILPLDANNILVLRDYAENVKRMLEMVNEIDVAVPSEFVQEVIPIKYAQASDIAQALSSLGAGGGATTVGATGASGGGRLDPEQHGPRWHGRRLWRGKLRRRDGWIRWLIWRRIRRRIRRQHVWSAEPAVRGGYPPGRRPSARRHHGQLIHPAAAEYHQPRVQPCRRDSGHRPDQNNRRRADQRAPHLRLPRRHEDHEGHHAKLDVVLPQVLIESAVISVSLTGSRDLGFSYLQHPQNIGQWTGVGALNNKTFQSPGNYLLNANGVTNGSSGVIPGGFTYLMSFGQDLDVALRRRRVTHGQNPPDPSHPDLAQRAGQHLRG